MAVLIGNIIVFFWIYREPKPMKREGFYDICVNYKIETINELIYRAYYVRGNVIFELMNGEQIDWKCDYSDILSYRDHLKDYPLESMIEKLIKRNFQTDGSLDSIYKPSNSFDLYIYINSNPDSLIYLPCGYDCEALLHQK